MAIGMLSALRQAGRSVPADLAVVSCDDIPFAVFLTPPLTTVRIPLAETGRQAVEVLLRSIAARARRSTRTQAPRSRYPVAPAGPDENSVAVGGGGVATCSRFGPAPAG